jgi:indoleamine 2,3-dioxygenase
MVIVTFYIVLPAKRARAAARRRAEKDQDSAQLQGTGGTDLVNFLKGVRDKTADARIHPAKQNMDRA